MVYHGLPWFIMVYHGLPWFTIVKNIIITIKKTPNHPVGMLMKMMNPIPQKKTL